MSRQIELDGGEVDVTVYAGPAREDGGSRRRFEIHDKHNGEVADLSMEEAVQLAKFVLEVHAEWRREVERG